jgi:hypothetical protein
VACQDENDPVVSAIVTHRRFTGDWWKQRFTIHLASIGWWAITLAVDGSETCIQVVGPREVANSTAEKSGE